MLKKNIDIGKTISKRIIDYPVFKKEPKKPPMRWVLCPDLKVWPSKKLLEREIIYSISVFTESHRAAGEALDSLIKWGNKEIEARRLKFWLHAVKYSITHVKGRPVFRADIKYIFRVEEIQEEDSRR